MVKKSYSDLLKDPRWQKKRLEIMKRDKFACKLCGDKETTLNVHHKKYKNGNAPWEYDNDNFITVCEDCHNLLFTAHKMNIGDYSNSSILKKRSISKTKILYFIYIPDEKFKLVLLHFDEDNNLTFNVQFEGETIKTIKEFISKIK